MQIDVTILDDAWSDALDNLETICADILAMLQDLNVPNSSELSVVLSNDAHIRTLNTQYREQDKPTNVLSFPVVQIAVGDTIPPMLGDVILALETIKSEAVAQNKSLQDHFSHLLLHGALHLLGYDHENDKEAEQMESLEKQLLEKLNIEDPYI